MAKPSSEDLRIGGIGAIDPSCKVATALPPRRGDSDVIMSAIEADRT
jgi:hypothetical protein